MKQADQHKGSGTLVPYKLARLKKAMKVLAFIPLFSKERLEGI